MKRYRALRHLGVGPFAAATIAFMNWAMGHPPNEIHFAHIVIEFEGKQS